MLANVCLTQLRAASQCLRLQARRNIAVSSVIYQKSAEDPVQQMFVQKVREYAQKQKAAGGKLVDITPQSQKELDAQLARLEKTYNAKGQDMTKFPTFTFQDQDVETLPVHEREGPKDLPI